MGLFRKKPDPLAQRAQSLNRRIAELEAEISRLSQGLSGDAARRPTPAQGSPSRPAQAPGTQHEPVFERIPPRPQGAQGAGEPGQEAVDMGLRRPGWAQIWRRLRRDGVEPPPGNDKLMSYLAAGGIHGFRPLRYERRVARNRIIFVCVIFGLLLWGLLVALR